MDSNQWTISVTCLATLQVPDPPKTKLEHAFLTPMFKRLMQASTKIQTMLASIQIGNRHSLPKSFGQNNTVEKSLRFSNTLASLARLSFVLLFFPCWDKQTQQAFSLCYSSDSAYDPPVCRFDEILACLMVTEKRHW